MKDDEWMQRQIEEGGVPYVEGMRLIKVTKPKNMFKMLTLEGDPLSMFPMVYP